MTTPTLPRWADVALLPALNLLIALAAAGVVARLAGHDPAQVLPLLVRGAFGNAANLSYTLYYATTFVCTALAVSVAFHAGQFNIGGEGQALMGGLGTGLVALALGPHLPGALLLPLMLVGAMAAGALWGAVPGALRAWRGSHTVITTIMFNFIASALLSYLMVNVLKEPGSMSVETARFADSAHLPGLHELLALVGIDWPATPLNASIVLAVVAAVAVHLLLWRSRTGYAWRATGHAPDAALYAGIAPRRQIVGSMALAGALAGLVGMNEIAGVHHRLLLDYVGGAGFAGIAVALIGRNHPAGIVAAAVLFGALYQGGAELAFEIPGFSRDMVFTLQGLIVLCCGAMGQVLAAPLARVLRRVTPASAPGGAHG